MECPAVELQRDVVLHHQVDGAEFSHPYLTPHRPATAPQPYSRGALQQTLRSRIDPVTQHLSGPRQRAQNRLQAPLVESPGRQRPIEAWNRDFERLIERDSQQSVPYPDQSVRTRAVAGRPPMHHHGRRVELPKPGGRARDRDMQNRRRPQQPGAACMHRGDPGQPAPDGHRAVPRVSGTDRRVPPAARTGELTSFDETRERCVCTPEFVSRGESAVAADIGDGIHGQAHWRLPRARRRGRVDAVRSLVKPPRWRASNSGKLAARGPNCQRGGALLRLIA